MLLLAACGRLGLARVIRTRIIRTHINQASLIPERLYQFSGFGSTRMTTRPSEVNRFSSARKDFIFRVWNAFNIGMAWGGGFVRSFTWSSTPSLTITPNCVVPIRRSADKPASKPQFFNTLAMRFAYRCVSGLSAPSAITKTDFRPLVNRAMHLTQPTAFVRASTTCSQTSPDGLYRGHFGRTHFGVFSEPNLRESFGKPFWLSQVHSPIGQ